MKCMPKWGPKTHGVIEVIEGLKAPKKINLNLIIGKKKTRFHEADADAGGGSYSKSNTVDGRKSY